MPVGKTRAYGMLSLGKENLSKESKIKLGRKKSVNVKNMTNQVFNDLDENMAMTSSDVATQNY